MHHSLAMTPGACAHTRSHAVASTSRGPLATAQMHAFGVPTRMRAGAVHGARGRTLIVKAAEEGVQQQVLKVAPMSYEHLLIALFDDNAYLSDFSRQAVATTAGLAAMHGSKVTVLFVDETGKQPEGKQRIDQIERAMQQAGCNELEFVERESEPSQGKGSVAVGDVADQLSADLVVLPSACVHEKHVDANLLAEFVPCPVLLLP